MNWAEFREVKQRALGAYDADPFDACESLMMNGTTFDNNMGAMLRETGGRDCNTTIQSLFGGDPADFVWIGSGRARVNDGPLHKRTQSGHPGLARGGIICCAGRVEHDPNREFFFHSGHYKPKARHVIPFMIDVIENTCAGLNGTNRDQKVHELASFPLKLYRDNSSSTYSTTFDGLIARYYPSADSSSYEASPRGSRPIPIGGRSAPIPIGGAERPHTSSPVTMHRVQPLLPEPVPSQAKSNLETSLILGASQTARMMYASPEGGGRPRWVPDSDVSKCQSCRREFTLFVRRHHCRACGNIFCADCSDRTMTVRNPATRPGKTPTAMSDGAVRVCRTCHLTGNRKG